MHALWAEHLYSPVKWSWLWTFLSVDLNGLVQIGKFVALLHSLHCSWVSRFIAILLARCCLQMVAVAKTQSQNFSVASSLILTWVVQSIPHHCTSYRCSSHMVCDSGRISMTMAHKSLVYVKHFPNQHRWQKVNVVAIFFL